MSWHRHARSEKYDLTFSQCRMSRGSSDNLTTVRWNDSYVGMTASCICSEFNMNNERFPFLFKEQISELTHCSCGKSVLAYISWTGKEKYMPVTRQEAAAYMNNQIYKGKTQTGYPMRYRIYGI